MSGNISSGRQTEMREIPVEEAVGMRLAHDLTQIIPGQFKGRKYKRGHLITEADLPGLLDIGKAHIYTLDIGDNDLHEDDAAGRLAAALQGEGIVLSEPHEGKVTLRAQRTGLAVIPPALVESINRIGEIALATVRHHTLVREGQPVAATRAIPLVLPKSKVEAAEKLTEAYRLANDNIAPIQVRPLRRFRVGLLTTGSEVYSGRIEDKFGPVVRTKLEALGSEVVEQRFTPDDRQTIVNHIRSLSDSGYDMILVTGGMSVDPDDRTPGAIREAGAHIVSYGTPMLPGSMLLIGYLAGVPIMGLPGCVMHDPHTSFDVLLPRILAGDTITQEDIVTMGYGGLHGC